MQPFFSIFLIVFIPFLAYGTAIILNHSILWGYKKASSELEFPEKLTQRATHTRRQRLTFVLFIFYGLALWAASSWPLLLIYVVYAAILGAIIVMDFEQQIILNTFVLALALLALAATPVLSAALTERILAGAGSFAIFLLLAVLTRGGIGGGDIKLIGALGLFLGLDRIIFTVVCGIIAGGLVSLFLLSTKRKKRKDAIAYGPYFAIAAMIALYV